jgi:rhodanese-related sulfurtransferase
MLTKIAIALAALVAVYLFRTMGTVGPAEARQRVADGALLLDVRTPSEYSAGHLRGAINIPVQELPGRLGELGDPSRSIVVYCRSGARSGQAKRLMTAGGFDHVADLGAMSRWE